MFILICLLSCLVSLIKAALWISVICSESSITHKNQRGIVFKFEFYLLYSICYMYCYLNLCVQNHYEL